jgi:hypothetical protein
VTHTAPWVVLAGLVGLGMLLLGLALAHVAGEWEED